MPYIPLTFPNKKASNPLRVRGLSNIEPDDIRTRDLLQDQDKESFPK